MRNSIMGSAYITIIICTNARNSMEEQHTDTAAWRMLYT